MTLNIRPLGDRILVEAVEEKEVKKGGIIIPDTAKEKPMESRVVALGTGKTDDNGKKVPFEMSLFRDLLVDFHWAISMPGPGIRGFLEEKRKIAPSIRVGWRAAATDFRTPVRVAAGRHA